MRKIAADKWKHFLTGIPMGILLQAAALYMGVDNNLWRALLVLSAIIAISYGFELFSKFSGKGHHDVKDAIASIIGGICGMLLFYGMEWMMG